MWCITFQNTVWNNFIVLQNSSCFPLCSAKGSSFSKRKYFFSFCFQIYSSVPSASGNIWNLFLGFPPQKGYAGTALLRSRNVNGTWIRRRCKVFDLAETSQLTLMCKEIFKVSTIRNDVTVHTVAHRLHCIQKAYSWPELYIFHCISRWILLSSCSSKVSSIIFSWTTGLGVPLFQSLGMPDKNSLCGFDHFYAHYRSRMPPLFWD